MGALQFVKIRGNFIKNEAIALYYAMRHPKTPLLAKILAFVLVGYVLSPIDIIPDFIPVFGYLDEIVLVPMVIRLIERMIPPGVMEDSRHRAKFGYKKLKTYIWLTALFVLLIPLITLVFIVYLIYRLVR